MKSVRFPFIGLIAVSQFMYQKAKEAKKQKYLCMAAYGGHPKARFDLSRLKVKLHELETYIPKSVKLFFDDECIKKTKKNPIYDWIWGVDCNIRNDTSCLHGVTEEKSARFYYKGAVLGFPNCLDNLCILYRNKNACALNYLTLLSIAGNAEAQSFLMKGGEVDKNVNTGNLTPSTAAPSLIAWRQERDAQNKAYEASLAKDQEKDRLTKVRETYPEMIKVEEEKVSSLQNHVMQKTRFIQQKKLDLSREKDPQKQVDIQQEIEQQQAELMALAQEKDLVSNSLKQKRTDLEEAQKSL
jgi:hypothetical protein